MPEPIDGEIYQVLEDSWLQLWKNLAACLPEKDISVGLDVRIQFFTQELEKLVEDFAKEKLNDVIVGYLCRSCDSMWSVGEFTKDSCPNCKFKDIKTVYEHED